MISVYNLTENAVSLSVSFALIFLQKALTDNQFITHIFEFIPYLNSLSPIPAGYLITNPIC